MELDDLTGLHRTLLSASHTTACGGFSSIGSAGLTTEFLQQAPDGPVDALGRLKPVARYESAHAEDLFHADLGHLVDQVHQATSFGCAPILGRRGPDRAGQDLKFLDAIHCHTAFPSLNPGTHQPTA
jgi:hypothetical protein